MNFYAVIIGTEILNGRREDKHFEFLKGELARYGHELFASFIIKDDKELMKSCYRLILSDKNAVMFSFGGIGSTPDDLTREIAAEVFTSKPLQTHKEFKNDILQRFGEESYPHRIHMADLPEGSQLLFNPVNNMSGFSLQERFFFVPGFPQMAHPMIRSAIETAFSYADEKFRYTLLAQTSENTLISIMQQIPDNIELSSLPIFINARASVELSLSGTDEAIIQKYFKLFCNELKNKNIEYKLI
ncbi:MAG: competence/damage-inducible protein A [Sulfurimonas sp.]|jgi:molybdopterin-biosynthesis enzyme MoeA-like protein|nr:competence/damage-inducible protein A [Sulfurimonas sp.]MBU4024390.1 competence/damage-inducible protein A [bacterium]MBU4059774.1 competence/damage-inducible protein A [bacterium]MBU4110657.1 competence/damage-inducible protein A [bacterium]